MAKNKGKEKATRGYAAVEGVEEQHL